MSPRRSITVAGCLTALACSASTTAADGSAAAPRCSGSDMAGAIIDIQGAAGSEFGRVILINTSSGTCRLKGFVRAKLLDKHKHPLHTHVTRDHSTPAKRVVVAPGAAAAFEMRWSNVPSGSKPCKQARWVRIFPPRSSSAVRVHFDAAPCRGDLEVRAITDPTSA